jgi:hypothetical protein
MKKHLHLSIMILIILTAGALQAGVVPKYAVRESIAPPINLQAEVVGNNVNLTWSASPQPQWLYWDDGFTWSYFALSGIGTYRMALRFSPTDLQELDGMYLTRFSANIGDASAGYQLKIYKGAAGNNLVYSQTLTDIVANTWNTFELTMPVEIDASSDLFIAIQVTNAGNYLPTIGLDNGPAVVGKGDLVSFDGTNWYNLASYGFDRNFSMRAYADISAGGKAMAQGQWLEELTRVAPAGNIRINPAIASGEAFNSTRDLLGYNVYRDNIKINSSLVTSTAYADNNVPPAAYTYHVTTVLNGDESAASVPVNVSPGAIQRNYSLHTGWNSISSDIIPAFTDAAIIGSPISDKLVMISNLTGTYYPAYNVNTLGNWDVKNGYMIKVSSACELPFDGFTNTNRNANLVSGWNLISVLSACDVNTAQLFIYVLDKLVIVKEAAGTGVFWPEQDVNTLPVLVPGKSYLVKMTAGRTVVFPVCP